MEDAAMFAEWEAWKKLCVLLKDARAVTEKDLSSPQGSTATQGQRLLVAIQDWGNKLATIRTLEPGERRAIEAMQKM